MTLRAQVGDAAAIISTLRKIGDTLGVVRASPTTSRVAPTVKRCCITVEHPDKTTTNHEIEIGDADKWLTLGEGPHVRVNEANVITGGLGDVYNGKNLEELFSETKGKKKSAGAKEQEGSKEKAQGSGASSGKEPETETERKNKPFEEEMARKEAFKGK